MSPSPKELKQNLGNVIALHEDGVKKMSTNDDVTSKTIVLDDAVHKVSAKQQAQPEKFSPQQKQLTKMMNHEEKVVESTNDASKGTENGISQNDDCFEQAVKETQRFLESMQEDSEVDAIDSASDSGDDEVFNFAHSIYKNELQEIKSQYEDEKLEREAEIAHLKSQLETKMHEDAMQKKLMKTKIAAIKKKEEEIKIPLIQEIEINGARSQMLIASFLPCKGKIGLKIKQYGKQLYVHGVVKREDTQISKYIGISEGLLVYQVVTSEIGEKSGRTIRVSKVQELRTAIVDEMLNGRMITMKFIVPPAEISAQCIHQDVLNPAFKNKIKGAKLNTL